MQPALSVAEFPCIILCKYTITSTLCPEQLTAGGGAERPNKLVLLSREARMGEGKCYMKDGEPWHMMNSETLEVTTKPMGIFALTFTKV